MQLIAPETARFEPETLVLEASEPSPLLQFPAIEPEPVATPAPEPAPEPTPEPTPARPPPAEVPLSAELTLIDHVPVPELVSELLSQVTAEPVEALADATESTPTPEDREAEHLKRAQAHLEAKSKAEKKAWAKATVKSKKKPRKTSAKLLAKLAGTAVVVELVDGKITKFAKPLKAGRKSIGAKAKAVTKAKPAKPTKAVGAKSTKPASPVKAEKLPPWELASPPKYFKAPEYLPLKTQFLHHHGKFISLFGKKLRVRPMDAFTRKAHGLVNIIGSDKGGQCVEPTLMVFTTKKAAATFFAMCADADDDVFNWIETGDGVEWHAEDWDVVNSNVMNGADLDE